MGGEDVRARAQRPKGVSFLRKRNPLWEPKENGVPSAKYFLLLPPCEWVQSTLPSNAAASLLLEEVPASPLGGYRSAHCGTSRPGRWRKAIETAQKQRQRKEGLRESSDSTAVIGGGTIPMGFFFFGNPKGFSFSQKRKVVWPPPWNGAYPARRSGRRLKAGPSSPTDSRWKHERNLPTKSAFRWSWSGRRFRWY